MSDDNVFSDIPNVKIDSKGRFKYILIKLNSNGIEKFVVRGHAWAEFHGIFNFIKLSVNNLLLVKF